MKEVLTEGRLILEVISIEMRVKTMKAYSQKTKNFKQGILLSTLNKN